MSRIKPYDVSIGKFNILATYSCAKARLDGLPDEEAREKGIAAKKKKKTSITTEPFDHRVADKRCGFFDKVFLPTIKEAGRGRALL